MSSVRRGRIATDIFCHLLSAVAQQAAQLVRFLRFEGISDCKVRKMCITLTTFGADDTLKCKKVEKKYAEYFRDQNDGRKASKEVFRLSCFDSQLNASHNLSSLQQYRIKQLLNSVFRDV